MCEWIDGELIVSFPKVDLAALSLIEDIRLGLVDGVSHVESLAEKLGNLGLQADPNIEFDFHRLRVPTGQELWKITYLQFFYKIKLVDVLQHSHIPQTFWDALRRSDYQFNVAPNNILSLAIKWPLQFAPSPPIRVADFTFSSFHSQYKSYLNVPPSTPPVNADQIRVLIVDTGIADDVPFQVADERNFVDPKNGIKATDDNGHGTAVALIINELIPDAKIIAYKAVDTSGRASEWDTLASLAAKHDAHIINISLSFGLEARKCKTCGRESESSRSQVFETILDQFENRAVKPILVAAAGNDGDAMLSYPARFGQVLAIESITSQKELSTFSNYGNRDPHDQVHSHRFTLPGGESDHTKLESIGQFGSKGNPLWGTSFAAAYATGIVANIRAQLGIQAQSDAVLNTLLSSVDQNFVNYNQTEYGNGLLRL